MKEFEMTDEQRARILDASRPVPYIVVGGIEPRSPQENANDAWRELGRELGFDSLTVRPVAGKSDRFFLAEPTEQSAALKAHFGDPCIYCHTPHDDVPPGPCQGRQ